MDSNFGFDVEGEVKKGVLKVDLDKDGQGDVMAGLDEAYNQMGKVLKYIRRLNKYDIEEMIVMLPMSVREKYSEKEQQEFVVDVLALSASLDRYSAYVRLVEKALMSK